MYPSIHILLFERINISLVYFHDKSVRFRYIRTQAQTMGISDLFVYLSEENEISRHAYRSLLGYDIVRTSRWLPMFWMNLLLPSSGNTYTLNMKLAGSSKTVVTIYKATQCHKPGGYNVKLHWHENLRFHIRKYVHVIYRNWIWPLLKEVLTFACPPESLQ